MKKLIIIYLALLLLLVMGAFASMALNAYGIWLMSCAALAFFFVFLFELVRALRQESESADRSLIAIELTVLVAMCLVFFLKGQMIDFPLSMYSSQILIFMLFGINVISFLAALRGLGQSPSRIKLGLALYFAGMFLLMAAMYSFSLSGMTGLAVTVCGLGTLAYFFATSGRRSALIVNGERTSAIGVVLTFRGKSFITIIALALMTTYFSLNALNILPSLYYGAMPNAYSKVQQAAKADGGVKADPKAFEEAYKEFIRNK